MVLIRCAACKDRALIISCPKEQIKSTSIDITNENDIKHFEQFIKSEKNKIN